MNLYRLNPCPNPLLLDVLTTVCATVQRKLRVDLSTDSATTGVDGVLTFYLSPEQYIQVRTQGDEVLVITNETDEEDCLLRIDLADPASIPAVMTCVLTTLNRYYTIRRRYHQERADAYQQVSAALVARMNEYKLDLSQE